MTAQTSAASILAIQKGVAEFYSVSLREMLGKGRARRIARPRMMAMYLCNKLTSHSSASIGRAFNRDHSTVLHGIRTIKAILAKYPELHAEKDQVVKQIGLQDAPAGISGALMLPVSLNNVEVTDVAVS